MSKITTALKILRDEYGEVKTDLNYQQDWQFLIAVMLSAQTTDKNVNKSTLGLFEKYKSLDELANSNIEELESLVYSTGYYRAKARNLKAMARMVMDSYDSKIPNNFNDLIKLPGVGRKTANVVCGVLWNNQQGIVVDTHVARVSYRLGLSTLNSKPEKIEKELNQIVPRNEWENYSLYLINHGRKYCITKPKCSICPLSDICPKVGVGENI